MRRATTLLGQALRRVAEGGPVASLALVLYACGVNGQAPVRPPGSGAPPAAASASAAERTLGSSAHPVTRALLRESLNALRFVGRVDRSDPGRVRYAWSGTGFRVRFRGAALHVYLEDEQNQHTVVVDGRVSSVLRAEKDRRSYILAEGLADAEHLVEVYRRTEALFGVTTVLGLVAPAGTLLDAPPPRARRIEIVGDSISCGYGNEGQRPSCSFGPDTENHYLSYGALLARRFDADLDTIAWSGRGVVRNFGGEPGELMPALYERILPAQPTSRWDSPIPADVVLINLGTNDYSTEPDPPVTDFAAAYAELLTEVRARSPRAFILCTIGPMLHDEDLARARQAVEMAVDRRRAAGDQRVESHRLRTPNSNPGCDWHPGVATHAAMAEELGRVIAARTGW